MSMTMMDLTLAWLVGTLSPFALMNPLVVLENLLVALTTLLVVVVLWGQAFLF